MAAVPVRYRAMHKDPSFGINGWMLFAFSLFSFFLEKMSEDPVLAVVVVIPYKEQR